MKNLDMMSIALGAIGGYILAMSMKDKKEEKPASGDTPLAGIHLGALQLNNPYGALQLNPYGALQLNPSGAHMPHGARAAYSPAGLQTQQAGLGAIQNPYGAVHLGALAEQG